MDLYGFVNPPAGSTCGDENWRRCEMRLNYIYGSQESITRVDSMLLHGELGP